MINALLEIPFEKECFVEARLEKVNVESRTQLPRKKFVPLRLGGTEWHSFKS